MVGKITRAFLHSGRAFLHQWLCSLPFVITTCNRVLAKVIIIHFRLSKNNPVFKIVVPINPPWCWPYSVVSGVMLSGYLSTSLFKGIICLSLFFLQEVSESGAPSDKGSVKEVWRELRFELQPSINSRMLTWSWLEYEFCVFPKAEGL